MSLPLAATLASDNSTLEDASELYEPLKDSWSPSLHWKKAF